MVMDISGECSLGWLHLLIFPKIFVGVFDLYLYPLILTISLIGCFLGTFLTPADDEETLKNFYKKVRPWGFWKPIHDKVQAEDPSFVGNKEFKRDAFNVIVGVAWQMSMVVIPIYLVIRDYMPLGISIGVLLLSTFLLKKYWWNTLPND